MSLLAHADYLVRNPGNRICSMSTSGLGSSVMSQCLSSCICLFKPAWTCTWFFLLRGWLTRTIVHLSFGKKDAQKDGSQGSPGADETAEPHPGRGERCGVSQTGRASSKACRNLYIQLHCWEEQRQITGRTPGGTASYCKEGTGHGIRAVGALTDVLLPWSETKANFLLIHHSNVRHF